MGDVTWCGCWSEPGIHDLASHLGETLAKFLELAAVLEHVAGLLFAILLVDVEVDGAGTQQLVVCRGFIVTAATLPSLCGASSVAEVASMVSSVAAVAIVASIS